MKEGILFLKQMTDYIARRTYSKVDSRQSYYLKILINIFSKLTVIQSTNGFSTLTLGNLQNTYPHAQTQDPGVFIASALSRIEDKGMQFRDPSYTDDRSI